MVTKWHRLLAAQHGRVLARHVSLVAAIVVLAAFPAAASGGIVTPHHIDETFAAPTIDYTNTWAWWGTNQPGLIAFNQGNGVMTVNVSAAAQPDFNASGQTRCLAHGNFDAQVDFKLVNWPAQNGVWVSLMVGGTPYNVYRVSWQFDPSDSYGAYLPPASAVLPASGKTGTLRLTRQGDILTAYYLSGRNWIPLVSGTGPTNDVPLNLAVFNISNAATFASEPVTVSFDNFHVVADSIICP
jgi:hypothetical protein